MKQIIEDKRQEYTHYLSSQLLKNDETVKLEKAALEKLQNSLQSIQDNFKQELDAQLKVIKAEEEKAAQQEKAFQEGRSAEQEQTDEDAKEETDQSIKQGEESKSQERDDEESEQVVDSYRIAALTTMLDDFENILGKNFCQFANYEDFSFAKSRTTEAL